ncbi:hypothetical protein SAMN06295987_104313 [Novosphingobium mathurense]|uniref:Uncharacterized protein n=1 Tax=Novosphingobium mathurense TaxID=428990 RepID=A0A1U6I7G2_9SPHN|nr:hypothetical protein SAMN06295987_104313 [Novosphingobium mathurense]
MTGLAYTVLVVFLIYAAFFLGQVWERSKRTIQHRHRQWY